MRRPFTPEQEARIREIVREEIPTDQARASEVLAKVVSDGLSPRIAQRPVTGAEDA